MPDVVYLLAVLVCPITMGVMMLVMMRSGGQHRTGADEVERLRGEVEQLRAAQNPTPELNSLQRVNDSRTSSGQ